MQVTAHAALGATTAGRDTSCSTQARRRPLAWPAPTRSTYLSVLTWSFTFFSTARILAYLPTFWAILESGDASQHSLWTWLTWLGSNLTMAVWLYEQGGQRTSRAVLVNLCNAVMCGAIVTLIVAYR